MSNVVQIAKDMISAIPDGAANMRNRVDFFFTPDELMEITPWLNDWNKSKVGKFNGIWTVRSHSRDDRLLNVFFKSIGM